MVHSQSLSYLTYCEYLTSFDLRYLKKFLACCSFLASLSGSFVSSPSFASPSKVRAPWISPVLFFLFVLNHLMSSSSPLLRLPFIYPRLSHGHIQPKLPSLIQIGMSRHGLINRISQRHFNTQILMCTPNLLYPQPCPYQLMAAPRLLLPRPEPLGSPVTLSNHISTVGKSYGLSLEETSRI